MSRNGSQLTILAVDDAAQNLDLLGSILRPEYKVKVATSGDKAIKIAKTPPHPDLILLDIMMPAFDGFATCARLKEDKRTENIPVIFVTALAEVGSESRGLELGAVDYITKPFNPNLVKARVSNHLALKRYRDHLEMMVEERSRELKLTKEVTMEAMGTLAEYRDPETGGHIRRTQNYVKLLAEQLIYHPRFMSYLDAEIIELLYMSAPLHDIGKVAVRDSILLKPGKLTDEEFDEMKRHTVYGHDALLKAGQRLGENSFLRIASEIAISHHEKWDGSGYPYALKGDDIPVAGRIMALADVYDALISKRVYKPPFPHKEAVQIIIEGKGNHFDLDIVDAFLSVEDAFRNTAIEYADSEEERQTLLQGF